MAFAKEWVIRGSETLEKLLSKTAGKYSFGDEITAADCCIYPHVVGGAARFNIDFSAYPTLNRVVNNLKENEAFVKAEPKNQPDFEK
jgi:glutathione S-transferase